MSWKGGVLKICRKFKGEHSCQSVISIMLQICFANLQSNFIEITLRHGYSPVNLLHIFRTRLYKNVYEELLRLFILNKNWQIFQFSLRNLKKSCKLVRPQRTSKGTDRYHETVRRRSDQKLCCRYLLDCVESVRIRS